MKKILPNNLRKIRISKGLTLVQVAEKLGSTHEQIRRLEVGERQLTHAWMNKFVRAYNVNIAEILPESGAKASSHSTAINNKDLVYKIIELAAVNARKHPKLPVPLIVSVVLAVFAEAQAGRIAGEKSETKLEQSLAAEAQKLINYELSKNA